MAAWSRRTFLGLAGSATLSAPGHGLFTRSLNASLPSTPFPFPGLGRPLQLSVTQEESNKAGTADWRITNLGTQHAVEAFADRTDVLPGERVTFFVSSTARRVRLEAFRMGWYRGALARRIAVREDIPVHRQSHLVLRSATNTITAPWHPSLSVDTSGWPEGAYLIRFTADTGQRYVPLIVRSATTTGKLLLVHATATWQAYNTWGGYSLYQGPGGPIDYGDRSYVVSFDRPYDRDGAHKFLEFELPVVALVDKLGLPTAYATNRQVHSEPQLLTDAVAIISPGHDEYWTPEMRANVTAARDSSVNVAFLGANACFRRIRFRQSNAGPDRQVICYKTDYWKDPLYGVRNQFVTNDFREPPDANPECTLTGTYYEAFPTSGSYLVYSPDSWLFRGTGVTVGTSFPGLIGPEYDRVNPVVPLPRPLEVLGHSPIVCKGVRTYCDSAYYTTPSGSGVFNAGTMAWTRALLRSDRRTDVRTARFVTQTTVNLLTMFAAAPAGVQNRAHDNLHAVRPYIGDPTWVGQNLW